MKTRRALLLAGAGVLLIALLALPGIVNLLTDWYWFQSLGFQVVFVKQFTTQLTMGTVVGIVAALFYYVNLRLAQRGLVPNPIVFQINPKSPGVDLTAVLRRLVTPISIALGFLIGISSATAWLTLQRMVHSKPFGTTDPVFGRDVSYYVFTLPGLSVILSLAMALVFTALLIVLPLYLLRRDIVFNRKRITIERSAELHLAVLVALLFLVQAFSVYFVQLPSILYSHTGPLFGASYTDLAIREPILTLLALTSVAGAILVLLGTRNRRMIRNAGLAVLMYFGVAVVLGQLVPGAYQKFVVVPNELVREGPQLKSHIEATRRAWGLAHVTVRDLAGDARLTLDDIRKNQATIKNVRLWDRDPIQQTFGQLQEIRTYYDFVSVDDDRYWIDGEYRQVLLSPRELNSASLPERNFINEHLTFTHGMGLTLSPVNQVSEEGLPVLFIKDLPPVSSVSINVTRPGIYYGERSNRYVFVNTKQAEFDYPLGDTKAETVYNGTGGVSAGGLLRRLLFSLRFGSVDILFTDLITSDSKILFHRNIRERVRTALPFLTLDDDPYIVITNDGKLKWIIDAYTVSSRYPYSQALNNNINYMRNSVKVVVDAYDGDIKAYISDPTDPLIRSYNAIFPGILLNMDEMPEDIRAHIRYPESLFRVQAALYTTYHMDEPDLFYAREDQWQIPSLSRNEGSRDPFLRHIIMKLPGESQEEFIFMTPFTPRGKENLAAWMVARSDGDHYGEVVVYRFPRQSLVFGPTQIVNRINQNTEISRQISLWDQRGSEVIRGNLLVIPINESLIFVQALYLRAEGGRIPELKRVVLAYQNQVVMEETLSDALERMFGGAVGTKATPASERRAAASETAAAVPAAIRELAGRARRLYDQALAAQRRGDWATYGERIREMGNVLQQLEAAGGRRQ